MPPAARISDLTNHTGVITGPGTATVLIAGLPAAGATGILPGDMHTCPIPPPPAVPHPPSPIASGSKTVLIGGRPAARIGDATGCGASIITGAPTVLVGG